MALWDDKKLFDRILDRLTQREKGYVKFNKARDSIIDYFRPDLGADLDPDGDGAFFGENIYEGTAPWAVGVMASGFQGGLVSSDSDWLLHQMQQTELRDNDELDIWLQDVKVHISDVYNRSNFYKSVLPLFVRDGVSIGSPLMFIDEDVLNKKIVFLPQHYTTVFIFYNKMNEPEGVIVKDETWTTKQIFDMFGPSEVEAKEKFSNKLFNDVNSGRHHTQHTIIRAVFKTNDPIWNVEGFKKPGKAWTSVYFEVKTEEERKNIPLRTESYFSQPFVVWDIDKKPWESASRTPAFDAIFDVIGHMEAHKQQKENWQLKNRPPRAVLPDHRNIIDFGPEGLNYIEKADWNQRPEMIDMIGDIRISKEELEASAERIKRWFHTDQFLKFTDLTRTLKQQPTATQIIKIAAELAVQTSPAIPTFTGGALTMIDSRVIDIEARAGRGPFAPDVMANIQDIVLNNVNEPIEAISIVPVFVGPLARAQKVKQELDPILNGLGASEILFERFPDLPNAIREYGTLEDVLKATNYPLKNLKSEEEYDEIIKAINADRRQKEQQALALEMVKVAPNVSGPVDENSILANAVGAAE